MWELGKVSETFPKELKPSERCANNSSALEMEGRILNDVFDLMLTEISRPS